MPAEHGGSTGPGQAQHVRPPWPASPTGGSLCSRDLGPTSQTPFSLHPSRFPIPREAHRMDSYPLRAATALAFAQRRWGRRNHRNLAAKEKHRSKKWVTNDPAISPTNTRDSPSSCRGSSLIFLFLLLLPHILEEDRAALRGSAPPGRSSFPGTGTRPMSTELPRPCAPRVWSKVAGRLRSPAHVHVPCGTAEPVSAEVPKTPRMPKSRRKGIEANGGGAPGCLNPLSTCLQLQA